MSEILTGLNRLQREAVIHENGPLLIIAGPGSGKTRTVVRSIVYAIENGVLPDQILAFSFSRKAVKELKEQVTKIIGKGEGDLVRISTFHSFCRQVLREDITRLGKGYTTNFKEITENGQRNIIKELRKEIIRSQIHFLQDHDFPNSEEVLNFISKCKAGTTDLSNAPSEGYVKLYKAYQKRIKDNGWIDYDDQLLFTAELFEKIPAVRAKWQERYQLIFVDEYQDTDPIQYKIIKALAEKHQNLRVVGDDDQGIYGFRGADIQNILSFEEDYENARVISLGQNYRSTQSIVTTSQALADFNPDRRDKELFTKNFKGAKVIHLHSKTDKQEAETIAGFISRAIVKGNRHPTDFAVLYRTNKQGGAFKTAFKALKIPYQDSNDPKLGKPPDGVSLMTIHRSKGLEFPNVFVVGVCKDLIPHFNTKEEEWGEELRLLYVAMTRAKNWLCLSTYEKDKFERELSPFFHFIPNDLLNRTATLAWNPIPPDPEYMKAPQAAEEFEALPEEFLANTTVLGIDPGIQNVGWSVTERSSTGYTAHRYCTSTTRRWQDTLARTEKTVRTLINSYRPDAIAVEKLEGATQEWFRYVAGCVATIRTIANEHGIQCFLYTPQQLKYAATGNRKADKKEVQRGVKRICNLPEIPEPDHSADAIAASLCRLRSYLHSVRFDAQKQKMGQNKTGHAYLKNRGYEEAIRAFEGAIRIDPIYADAYCGLAEGYIVQGDLAAVENHAKTALRLTENNHRNSQRLLDAIKAFRRGCDLLKKQEWNEAVERFTESIDLSPLFAGAYIEMGRVYLGLGDVESSRATLKQILELTDDYVLPQTQGLSNAIAFYDAGIGHLNAHLYDRAIAEFKKSIGVESIFLQAHCGLAQAYLEQDNLAEAERTARNALSLNNTHARPRELLEQIKQAYYTKGLRKIKSRIYPVAIQLLGKALSISDTLGHDSPEIWRNLGLAYYRLKNYRPARDHYIKVIELDPGDEQAHCGLGNTYFKMGAYAEAVNSFKAACELKPNSAKFHCYLARALFKHGKLKEALQATGKSVAVWVRQTLFRI